MRKTLLAIAAAGLGLVGCVGGIESGGGSDPVDPSTGDDGNDNNDNPAGSDLTAAKQLFDQGVFPVIQKCSGGACHAENATGATLTRFVALDQTRGWQVAVNYTALVGNFAASAAPILTYITPGTHQGMTWSAPEVAAITAWLDKEVELRNGQPQGTGTGTGGGTESLSQATERVISEFAGCMTQANFDQANMRNAFGNMNCQNNQQCRDCHNNGAHGFHASDIVSTAPGSTWSVVSTRKYYWLQYFTVDLTAGAAGAKVIPNESSFIGVANGQDPHREHPRFNYNANNQGRQALQSFYDSTMARKTAGTCDPPKTLQ